MAAEEAATVRIVFADSEENFRQPVADFHTVQTSSGAKAYPADRDALALPKMPFSTFKVNENGKIILEAKGDAADIVESEESDGMIPIVLVHKATGGKVHKKLRVGDAGTADFSGFNSTHDITLNTSDFVKLGAYTVPRGYYAMLDAGHPVHCFLGDDT